MKVIQYDPNQQIINLGETFFKVVGLLVVSTPTSNDITLTDQQYLDWQTANIEFAFINQSKFTVATAVLSTELEDQQVIEDQKTNIINRMQQINNRRVALFDLGVSEPSLDAEYDNLMIQYNSL